ncbi:tRNA (adenosine(37)-N6)-threonylcarbamoyltransferase complex dimerization subunit type 1 TsaB [Oceanispirochaeta crateris]|uniref:tRNA (adenosine(37)-N6)-threonylcarbamoyltransferase complex dimerization subunit type 1 TsaB n=1 Tax=Oceanispirochaeta crateris TaxID=2518645 RepID=UPI00143DC388|nr:tRNA (adenosine(37)-N6)-threonylcarbamoyltransferase complex dimerization subunit type 1 TsaB [Oceanispirochaeta crateris]
MNCVLSVDTASSLLGVCLKKENSWFEMTIQDGLKHSENLMDTILLILKEGNVKKEELELLVCSEGPGSFTGLRIGMSTIKGMAFGLKIPHTTILTTDYLAYGYDYFPGAVVPILDARKKRYYCGIYSEGQSISGALDLSEDQLLAKLEKFENVLFTGPDCSMIKTDSRPGLFFDGNGSQGRSRQLLELGIKRFQKEGALDESSGPLYLRKSEAEIALYGDHI